MPAQSREPDRPTAPIRFAVPGGLPSLSGVTGWLNSQPLTTDGLRGWVVLVNFWTYTCINWLQQLPYLRAWASKYSEHGLLVVGVHTPEFGFEADAGNIARAARDPGVKYPVAIDSNYAVWNAFGNMYWPALYFADADGLLRQRHFGEGKYEQSEQVMQQLLAEAGSAGSGTGLVPIDARGAEAAADWTSLGSPETYLGYVRTKGFASPGGMTPEKPHTYRASAVPRLNRWALSGDWTVTDQNATLNVANGQIVYRFHARDLHLVMGPAEPETSVRFRALIDGRPLARLTASTSMTRATALSPNIGCTNLFVNPAQSRNAPSSSPSSVPRSRPTLRPSARPVGGRSDSRVSDRPRTTNPTTIFRKFLSWPTAAVT